MTSSGFSTTESAGRSAAFAVYALYLLSIPSAALFAPVGVVLAYVTRGEAGEFARSHLSSQIRLFWWAFLWGAIIAVITGIGWILTPVLIGFPIVWLGGAAGFIVMIWFTLVSLFGLLRLLDGRAA